ncbi:hypothetical protein UlMin_013780 [Ulmus minor]
MGSCVSINRSSDSAMKLRLSFGSKAGKLEIPPSPVKEKPANGELRIKDVALKPHWSPTPSAATFRDHGSKDEAFFDSKPWLDSDCEDDFYSVNGDFTPSRGNTPVHHQGSSTSSAQVNKLQFEERLPSGSSTGSSPTDKKKKLVELFRESIREDQEVDNQSKPITNGTMESKQMGNGGTPYVSGANSGYSSERTPNGQVLTEKDKPIRSSQCCLPSLVSCRSFSDRKKKIGSQIAVNGKL